MGFSLQKRIRSPRAPLPESRVRECALAQLNSVDKREREGNRAGRREPILLYRLSC
jgi:hypothetical protein